MEDAKKTWNFFCKSQMYILCIHCANFVFVIGKSIKKFIQVICRHHLINLLIQCYVLQFENHLSMF